jgi:phage-related protein
VETFRIIELYETETGRCHVQEFIETISRRVDRAKMLKVFENVEKMELVPTHFLKKLQGGHNLWEVRVRSFRFLGFYAGPGRLMLVHGFLKQSQKTPLHEIGVALTRQGAYLSRQR